MKKTNILNILEKNNTYLKNEVGELEGKFIIMLIYIFI